jgi:hypothetical protein
MNAISMTIVPFDSFAAYQREREHSRRMEALLTRSNTLLRMACINGGKVQDVEAVRAFLRECAE